ncbi:MAG: glycoside hydrolase family 3 protein [Mobilitalea sp.]
MMAYTGEIRYKEAPFFLSDEDICWVKKCLDTMDLEEKIGQLFCLTGITTDIGSLTDLVKKYNPGAYLTRAEDGEAVKKAFEAMETDSRIPMLFPCNLESGGNGIAKQGTFFARPLEIAATGNTEFAKKMGLVCAREGGSLGCNWTLAPIIDIDYNWRNPITNVRTFGSDPDTILKMASAYMDGVAESGFKMAVCIKHFPGDGVDERDQHLLPTINSLSAEEWMSSYGRLYLTLIEKGAATVMAGHILQPALERMVDPDIQKENMLPASQSRNLLTGILREKFDFNGLITTDATPMVGFSAMQRRADAIRLSIAAGADMIMFCKNIEEDYESVREGIVSGVITMERLNEAVARQLALKASLGIHRERQITADDSLVGCKEHKEWAAECADRAITLVKDTESLLPISPYKTPRIRLTVLGENADGGFGDGDTVTENLKNALENEGFAVAVYDYHTIENGEIFTSGVTDMKEKFDLSIVAANVSTSSNHTTRRLDWIPLMAADEPWYTKDIPTLFLSFCNPYHMIDVPFIGCFINCYASNSFCVDAVVSKLVGKSEFTGISPIDPYCERKDL